MVVSGASWEADQGRHGPLGLVIRDCLKGGSLCIISLVPIDIKIAARDPVHDGLKGVLIRFRTEDDDMATRLASLLLRVELVTIYAERECDLAARKDKDVVAFAAFADAATSSALNLKVGSGSRSHMETDCWCNWDVYAGGGI